MLYNLGGRGGVGVNSMMLVAGCVLFRSVGRGIGWKCFVFDIKWMGNLRLSFLLEGSLDDMAFIDKRKEEGSFLAKRKSVGNAYLNYLPPLEHKVHLMIFKVCAPLHKMR